MKVCNYTVGNHKIAAISALPCFPRFAGFRVLVVSDAISAKTTVGLTCCVNGFVKRNDPGQRAVVNSAFTIVGRVLGNLRLLAGYVSRTC